LAVLGYVRFDLAFQFSQQVLGKFSIPMGFGQQADIDQNMRVMKYLRRIGAPFADAG
jgi:hypothetical protein